MREWCTVRRCWTITSQAPKNSVETTRDLNFRVGAHTHACGPLCGLTKENITVWTNNNAMQPGNQAAETAGSRLGAKTKEENEVGSRWTMRVRETTKDG